MNKLRLEYNGNTMELQAIGYESARESWLVLEGRVSVGGKTVAGQDPSVELEDIVWLRGQLQAFLDGSTDKVKGYFMEPDFTLEIDHDTISIYFLPESTLWRSYPREKAMQVMREVPSLDMPYSQKDLETLLKWTEDILTDFRESARPKS